jgi:excisionase family DNA binding protein
METRLLKPEEVADYLNVGRSKVYELMRAGELESVRSAPAGACRGRPWTPTSRPCGTGWSRHDPRLRPARL